MPNVVTLRYLASPQWMETAILASTPLSDRLQTLHVDLDVVDSETRRRVEAIEDAFVWTSEGERGTVTVLDSGLDPDELWGQDVEEARPITDRVTSQIGSLPELPEPTNDPIAVASAWEAWLARYCRAALSTIEHFNEDPPSFGFNARFKSELAWGRVRVSTGARVVEVEPAHGATSMRDAMAGNLRSRCLVREFDKASADAAKEALRVGTGEWQSFADGTAGVGTLAADWLQLAKRRWAVAKAHYRSRHADVLSFDDEMSRWAQQHGSDRLRLGIEDGYRMNARYLAERLAREAPGFFAASESGLEPRWATRASSPSTPALKLRRKVQAAVERHAPDVLSEPPQATIMIVQKPPHEMYFADAGYVEDEELLGTDLPTREGWRWWADDYGYHAGSAKPFEAVVVTNWLGRFSLIGGARNDHDEAPPGLWAVPDPEHFADDGSVVAQDPDDGIEKARRKPPDDPEPYSGAGASDDDIPF